MKNSNLIKALTIMKQTDSDLYYSEILYITECIREKKKYYDADPLTLINILEDFNRTHSSKVKKEDLRQYNLVREIIREILCNK